MPLLTGSVSQTLNVLEGPIKGAHIPVYLSALCRALGLVLAMRFGVRGCLLLRASLPLLLLSLREHCPRIAVLPVEMRLSAGCALSVPLYTRQLLRPVTYADSRVRPCG